MAKAPKLDKATIDVVRAVLAMPPKRHEAMKVSRPAMKQEGSPKGRAS
jgi:hypothetical protein